MAPRRGPLGPSPDRERAIGNAPALVPEDPWLDCKTYSRSLRYRPRSMTPPMASPRARASWCHQCSAKPLCRCAKLNSAAASEKDAKLAQKLGQLQPFIAALPQEYMDQLAYFGPPNTFLAAGPGLRRAGGGRGLDRARQPARERLSARGKRHLPGPRHAPDGANTVRVGQYPIVSLVRGRLKIELRYQ